MAASRSRGLAPLLAVALLLPAGTALAQEEVAWKKAAFVEEGGWLNVSLGFRELLDASTRGRLRSGFATSVVMRIYLYEQSGGEPVAFAARSLKAVYDLWDEQFVVRIEEPGRSFNRRLRQDGPVVDRLTSLWRFPLARTANLRKDSLYFVAVIAEVNPMSEALLAEVRRWLRSPYGGRRGSGSESFFGSFVSIFVNNKIRSAERTMRVRTQLVYPGR